MPRSRIPCQREMVAEQNRDRLPPAAHAEVITELDRLLTVMARYACDGLQPSGADVSAPVPTRQELTVIGIRLTLLHATGTIHRIAQTPGNDASTGHAPATRIAVAISPGSLHDPEILGRQT